MPSCKCTESGLQTTPKLQRSEELYSKWPHSYGISFHRVACLYKWNVYASCAAVTFLSLLSYYMVKLSHWGQKMKWFWQNKHEWSGPERVLCGWTVSWDSILCGLLVSLWRERRDTEFPGSWGSRADLCDHLSHTLQRYPTKQTQTGWIVRKPGVIHILKCFYHHHHHLNLK